MPQADHIELGRTKQGGEQSGAIRNATERHVFVDADGRVYSGAEGIARAFLAQPETYIRVPGSRAAEAASTRTPW